ncbi:MAG: hypothetical protein VB032_00600 [Burkholderiaceae bacterium]|nr:hypothetical protein [Burkholderiaceae bacterium]
MKKLFLAAAVLFCFSTLALAQHTGGQSTRGPAAGKAGASRSGAPRATAPRRTAGVQRGAYRSSAYSPHPPDRYGYSGRHNDRFPPDRYYWYNGRHYYRYYQPFHQWVICIDGARYPAYPTACVGNGGVLYFW